MLADACVADRADPMPDADNGAHPFGRRRQRPRIRDAHHDLLEIRAVEESP